MITVNTVANLATARPGNGDTVRTRGYSVVGIGENEYRYDRTSSEAIDNVFVINGPGGRGRYIATDREVVDATKAGALGNGVADDSVALQRAVDAMPASGGVLFLPQLTYIVDNVAAAASILFNGIANFKVIGHGATIKANNAMLYDDGTVLLYFGSCTDFTVEGLTVDGNRANRTPAIPEKFAHSIVVADCDRFTFDRVRAVNAVTDGFYVSPTNNADASTFPRNGVFLNCSADNCFRQGMSIAGGYDIEVNGGSWTNSNGTSPEAGIDLEADVAQVGGSAVSRNIVWKNLYVAGNAGTGLQISDQQHESVLVDNCEITNNAASAMLLGGNTTVRNCNIHTFTAATANGIVDVYSSAWGKNIIIEGNTFSDISVAKPCIYTHGAHPGGVRVLNNTAENVYNFGIFVGRGTTMIGNRVSQDTTLAPIYTVAASGNDQHYEANVFQNFLTRCIYQEGERNKYLHNTFLNIYDDTEVPPGPVAIATIDAVTGSCRIDGNVFHNDVAKTTIGVRGAAASTVELSNSTVTNYAVDWVDENGGTFVSGAAAFTKIAVPGQADIDAGATLNVNAGNGIALATDALTDTLTVGLWDFNILHTQSVGVLNQKSFYLRNAADDGNAGILSATAGNNITLQALTADTGVQISAAGAAGLVQFIINGLLQGAVDASGINLEAGKTFRIDGTPVGGATNTFTTIAVATQTDVVADSAADTLTLVGAGGITITTDAATDTITFTGGGGGLPPDADYGDISITGGVWTVDPDVITYAKLQNVSATNRILGRIAAGAGDVEELTAANVLTVINVEAGADVTDATNVAAAGAVMEADTTTALMQFVIDEDTFASDLDTKVPTQQSTKAYIASQIAGVGGNAWGTVAVGATNVVADQTNDTLTLTAGSGIALTPNATTDTVDIATTGVVLVATTSTAGFGFVIDEDTLVSNLDTKVPTQQSVKAYVDAAVSGGVPDGDKGDITVSASGVTWTIDADAVTYAKLQNVSAPNLILGRVTGGAGDVEELSATSVRTIINVADGADVTDATSVAAAGAVMEADTTTALMQFVIDEDTMVSDLATKVPTQQSVKAYVDSQVGGNAFGTITVATQTDVVADAPGDTLTIAAGAGISISTTPASDTITITNTVAAGGDGTFTTLTADDSTPDVTGLRLVDTANTVATAYAGVYGGAVEGQMLEIHVNDANTSFVNNATQALFGGVDIPASTSPYRVVLRYDGTQWKQVTGGSEDHQFATASDGLGNLTLSNSATNADITIDADGTGVVNIVAADLQLNGVSVGGGGGNSFTTIAVATQSNVVADSATDTLTLVAGGGIAITTDAGTDTITIAVNSTVVVEGDTSTAGFGFVIDEDTMVSDSATKVPTQQSVKAYVDAVAGGHPIGEITAPEDTAIIAVGGATLVNSFSTNPTTITQFTTTEPDGQLFAFVATDVNTTIANNSNIVTLDGSNIVMALGDVAFFVHNGTISRQVAPGGGGGGGLPAGGSVGDLVVNTGSGTGSWSSVASVGANGVTITGGTVTDPATPLTITQTFNDAADTFDAIDVNVTNTASAAASRVLNLRVGGTSLVSVRASDGQLLVPAGSSTVPSIQLATGGGWSAHGTNGVAMGTGGSCQQTLSTLGVIQRDSCYFAIASGNPFAASSATIDCRLYRDAAAQWGIRNASATTTAQSLAIYTVSTNIANSYERLRIYGQSSAAFRIHTEDGVTAGDARDLELGTAATTRLTIGSAGHITIVDANDLIFGTTTGTKIGTATTQKLGFWNATPVVQQVLATGGGATVDNVISLLQTLGLCRQTA